jgi:uncharacterized HAD superfamily protein
MFNKHLSLNKDPIIANEQTMKEWEQLMIETVDIKCTHNSIYDLLSKSQQVIFLTARREQFREHTQKHLDTLKMGHYNIHFCGDTPKGVVLKKILEEMKYINHVIFIDDHCANLYTVYYHLSGLNLKLDIYRFEKPF